MARRVLITGSAGFIGFHTSMHLLANGAEVLGIDNFNDYYSPELKEKRNDLLEADKNFSVRRIDIADKAAIFDAWSDFRPDTVIHLAAQAGVRYSIESPDNYINTNLIGTFNLLEAARNHPIQHFLAASTSSVYGANDEMPFEETQRTQTPMSLYAATKGATELMGHSYSHLFGIPMTFFRFFTVYGPWGRPDMALFKFISAMDRGRAIEVFNNGEMARDFTYVEDLVKAIAKLAEAVPGDTPVAHDSLSPVAPFRVVNIGKGQPVPLLDYIAALEDAFGKKAVKEMLPMQPGDIPSTEASPDLLRELTGYVPDTSIKDGVAAFADWYRQYHRS